VEKLRPEDLDKIRKQMVKTMSLRDGDARAKVTVHMGTCGIAAGARKIMRALLEVHEQSGEADIVITTSGCAGLCSREPMVTVELRDEAPVKYVELNEDKAKTIYEEHVRKGRVVQEYALAVGSERVG
jgi:NADP-reducing hydrogenase subunit HndB